MFRSIGTAAIFAALIVPTQPSAAFAADPAADYATVQSRVYMPKVDFSDRDQVRAVYHRLTVEARYVCDQAATYANNYSPVEERKCEDEALADAVRDINRTQLSTLYDEKRGQAPIELSVNSPRR